MCLAKAVSWAWTSQIDLLLWIYMVCKLQTQPPCPKPPPISISIWHSHIIVPKNSIFSDLMKNWELIAVTKPPSQLKSSLQRCRSLKRLWALMRWPSTWKLVTTWISVAHTSVVTQAASVILKSWELTWKMSARIPISSANIASGWTGGRTLRAKTTCMIIIVALTRSRSTKIRFKESKIVSNLGI